MEHMKKLHCEIENYYKNICPIWAEHEKRLKIISQVHVIISSIWPRVTIRPFGSYATGLYTPISNLDLAIIGECENISLDKLEIELLNTNLVDEHRIQVLSSSVPPILEYTDKRSEIKVRIYLDADSGIRSTHLVMCYIKKYPALPKVFCIIKQFLIQRKLSDVSTGGITSYCLILMCISFFQMRSRSGTLRLFNDNTGILLLEFFNLYGMKFDYVRTGILINNGGAYIHKNFMSNIMNYGPRNSILCIADPVHTEEDAGCCSYGVWQAKQYFEEAYLALSLSIHDRRDITEPNCSLLEDIVKFPDSILQYRKCMQEKIGNNIPVMARLPLTDSTIYRDLPIDSCQQVCKRCRCIF